LTKKFIDLSKSSKDKYGSVVERLHTSGTTVIQAQKMSDLDLKTRIGFKGKKASFNAFKRNLNAIRTDTSKRQALPSHILPKYVKFGYRTKGLTKITAELQKTVGETFKAMVKDVENANPTWSEKEAIRHVIRLLKLPKSLYKKQPQSDRDILADHGY